MRYVGFSSQFHDAGLSIIEEDGSVSFAAHAERYTKVKNDPRLPYQLMELIKDDDVVSFEGSEELMLYISHSELLVLEGGKHDITYAEPSFVGAAIRDFLISLAKAEV